MAAGERLDERKRRRVHFALEPSINRGLEDRPVWACQCEQCQAGVQFHGVDFAKNSCGVGSWQILQKVYALQKPRTQDRVHSIFPRLIERGQSEYFRHFAPAKASKLRKDEPHPMRTLMPLAQLGRRAAVGVAMGFNEKLEIGLHGYCFKLSPSTLTNVCCAGFYKFAHPGY